MTALFVDADLTVRNIEEQDVPVMTRWLTDPRILEYYEGRDKPYDEAKVRAEFLHPEENTDVACCIAEQSGV